MSIPLGSSVFTSSLGTIFQRIANRVDITAFSITRQLLISYIIASHLLIYIFFHLRTNAVCKKSSDLYAFSVVLIVNPSFHATSTLFRRKCTLLYIWMT
jgi:hypothetical protein